MSSNLKLGICYEGFPKENLLSMAKTLKDSQFIKPLFEFTGHAGLR